MFAVFETIPPTGVPITAAELRTRLRLNEQGEDAELDEFLASAVEQFELDALRPVLATGYRQDLSRWPAGVVICGRGGVPSITAVRRYPADGTTESLDPAAWHADISTPPARVYLDSIPPTEHSPVGCVEFTAGWPDPAAVPAVVRTALMLLAGHWYENREAYRDSPFDMHALPAGWWSVVNKFKLGLSGDWGQ